MQPVAGEIERLFQTPVLEFLFIRIHRKAPLTTCQALLYSVGRYLETSRAISGLVRREHCVFGMGLYQIKVCCRLRKAAVFLD
jgi:hypothetical protein